MSSHITRREEGNNSTQLSRCSSSTINAVPSSGYQRRLRASPTQVHCVAELGTAVSCISTLIVLLYRYLHITIDPSGPQNPTLNKNVSKPLSIRKCSSQRGRHEINQSIHLRPITRRESQRMANKTTHRTTSIRQRDFKCKPHCSSSF